MPPRPGTVPLFGLALITAAAGVSGTRKAGAAVRICEPHVSSGLVTGTSEDTARAAALAVWKSKALAHGEEYGSWRLAAEKTLACLPRSDGAFECLARAAPCTIEQAPDRRELRKNRIGI
jgi:hypothetical protein